MPKNKRPNPDESIEDFIIRRFEENFQRLRFENGHGLAPEVKEAAKRQVVLYWRRLREIAESVTDTEVRLNLPGQRTLKGRKFNIEGVVDIVREHGHTVMYDLKTHDPEYIRQNLGEYERQLNVYAHIWRNLRKQELNETAVIATRLPESLDAAWINRERNPASFENEVAQWKPVIPIPFDTQRVQDTVQAFGTVVDRIEGGVFSPTPVSQLDKKEVRNETFAMRVCRNYDVRFSCQSFREYLKTYKSRDLPRFKGIYGDAGPEPEREARMDAGLETTPP